MILNDPNIPAVSVERLKTQLARVAAFMSDGLPHTLTELAEAARAKETGASARTRDLRRLHGWTIEVWPDKSRPGVYWYEAKVIGSFPTGRRKPAKRRKSETSSPSLPPS